MSNDQKVNVSKTVRRWARLAGMPVRQWVRVNRNDITLQWQRNKGMIK